MFHLFYTDVAKVDQDVVYVALIIHVCCKRLFPMFYLFFQMYVTSVYLDVTYVFTHMLQVFYLDVTYVLQWFSSVSCVSSSVSMHVSNVLSVFIRILQVLYLDVAYIALAIHVC
jgi:hypothetical protein